MGTEGGLQRVNYLINLPKLFFQEDIINEFVQNNVRIRFIGDTSRFPLPIQEIMQKAVEITEINTGMILNFAMNYGGKADIIQAIKKCIQDGINIEEINEKVFEV